MLAATEKYLGGEQDIANAVNDRMFARVQEISKQQRVVRLYSVRFADSGPIHERHHLNYSEVTQREFFVDILGGEV